MYATSTQASLLDGVACCAILCERPSTGTRANFAHLWNKIRLDHDNALMATHDNEKAVSNGDV
jgi:hypothetical protein